MKTIMKAILMAIFSIAVSPVFSQTTLKGKVTNEATGLPVPAVSITVSESGEGTFTNDNGSFTLTTNHLLPVTLNFSSIGFADATKVVNAAGGAIDVILTPTSVLGQEVVVAATRTAGSAIDAPVTIETVNERQIQQASAPAYYDVIKNMNGVDMVTASLLFSSPSTRGFNGSGNLRMNQIMDGMDNQAPGLNFSVSSIVGVPQLDVANVELLQGASSALYGPGGMNGTLIINSKDPFKYQGLSFDMKTGIMNITNSARDASAYNDWSLRWAKKLSDKVAFKINTQMIQAKDWVGRDYRNYNQTGNTGFIVPGTRETDPNYNGINVYGDETTADIKAAVLDKLAAQIPFYKPYVDALPDAIPVSRTGYQERDLVNPNTLNYKISGQFSVKLSERTQMNAAGYFGSGNTVYTGSDRYALTNLMIAQYKLEVVNTNWFLRAYTTQENSGDAYNVTVTTRLFNEAWKSSTDPAGWYFQYATAFLNDKIAGMSDIDAHNAARAVADIGRPEPGTPGFKQIYDKVRGIPIVDGGGLFVDKTDLYVAEGQWDLSPHTKNVADILIGGDYKRFVLNSGGTLFADTTGVIPINEVGFYAQAKRKLFNDVLTLIASGRYDKNQNFKGKFTPRISAVIKVAPMNNLRFSYQQAYRFASTQQQWINLRVGQGAILVGGNKDFTSFYHFDTNPLYLVNDIQKGIVQPTVLDEFKAETVDSYEAGYKGLIANHKLLVDAYVYLGNYRNFITRPTYVQSVDGDPSVFNAPDQQTLTGRINDPSQVTIYSVPQNVKGKVKTYGYGLSLTYQLPRNFLVEVHGSSDHLSGVPEGFIAAFNTPEYRMGASFSNTGFGPQDKLGFQVAFRWQTKMKYESDMANGTVPAFKTVDAQFSYKIPKYKVLLKVGGTNLLNQYYINGLANSAVGGLYYFSVGYNLF